ncbi:DUF4870 domain-containing protein [Clavibacter tessellarius]|uniref:DUF4870 domain-containing protein n=1 Tax=Clavibacter tessellarius TaxID=31965 RepID=A0A225CE30_9MICO|nr:DUF4870 domain-containing protein [Clavibacter michiganensis]MBT1634198.1 DUF4870 domain-containing protein [Clavibacter michiganensis]OQJ64030.1 hypothetical protein B5P24_14000 [Clavibacter michiganensis subsp. tessellarius]UKF32997.1 DUF4870 domain-containing protein [Clavibacter michiganensis subsp. tessellarius]
MTDAPPTPPQDDRNTTGHHPTPPPGASENRGAAGTPGSGDPYSSSHPTPPLRPDEEKLWATLIHIGGVLFGFLIPLIGYLVLRDRGPFIKEHTRHALNFHLTMLIAYVAGLVLSVIGIGLLLVFAIWVVTIIFAIMAAVAANQGRPYKYPLSIELIKN